MASFGKKWYILPLGTILDFDMHRLHFARGKELSYCSFVSEVCSGCT